MTPPTTEHDVHHGPDEQVAPSRGQRRALDVLALAAVAVLCWVFRPVGIGMLLGALTGFTVEPLYDRLVHRFGRPRLAVFVCVVSSSLGYLVVLGGLGALVVSRGTVLGQQLIATFEEGGPGRVAAEKLIVRLGLQTEAEQIANRLREAATSAAATLASAAALVATKTMGMLLVLFFMTLTTWFVLRHWRKLEQRAIACLPLEPRHTYELLDELRRVGKQTFLGTVVTGVAQGTLAAIGYTIFQVPEAAFFGAATVFASLIPAVGTLLVWVPVGIWLIATGHVGAGTGELVYGGLVVVGISDYLIRPRLVGGDGQVPALLTFAGLFGGVELFGLIGLVLGPLLVGVAIAVLRLYAREVASTSTLAAAPPAVTATITISTAGDERTS